MKTVVMLLGALMMVIALAGIVVWSSTERGEPPVPAPHLEPTTAPAPASHTVTPAAAPGVFHTDVYFDFKSTRLRADAVGALQQHATLMTQGGTWTVLVQGHADNLGPAVYNRVLAERRAEVVRQFLIELGVPDTTIKTVAIGQDGALCDDPGPECQRLNRRVHVEMRRLTLPTPAPATARTHDIVEP